MRRIGLLSTLVLAVVIGGGAGPASRAALAAGPDFSLSASPPGVSVGAGVGGFSSTGLTATPSGGLTGAVTLQVSGVPAGVTAILNPGPASGTTFLELSASGSAAPGTTTITVTGTSGSLTHTLGIPLTVIVPVSDFAVFARPASLAVSPGASVTSTISATTQTGFNGSPTFSASGLPAGVTAMFGPTTTTSGGSTATLTLTASSTAAPASATVTVIGMAGAVTARATFSLTVTGAGSGGGGTGGVTVTPVVSSDSRWFVEEDVKLANPTSLTALSVTIVIQRTPGVSFGGQYNTAGGQILQSSSSTATTITYQFTLAPGQTLAPGSGWLFAAQASGTGTFHATAGDTYTVTWTTGGTSFTQSAHYPMVDPVP
jgi:hypothetical protein